MAHNTTLVFVHGFMGTDESFYELPNILAESLNVKTRVYEYQTSGDWNHKTDLLADYLKELGNTNIILIAHSMGGPLSVDATLSSKRSNIDGIIAIDSPFFGLDPAVANHGVAKVTKVVEQVNKLSSSWKFGLAAVTAAGAFAAALNPELQKSAASLINQHTSQWTERLSFLSPLMASMPDMRQRFSNLLDQKVKFHGYYLELQKDRSRFTLPEPFDLKEYFSAHKVYAEDVIEAHMNLFTDKLDGYAFRTLTSNIQSLVLDWIS